METTEKADTAILVDADFLDRQFFEIIVQSERMIGRRVPPADLADWLECAALDGGVRPGSNVVNAAFIFSPGHEKMENARPSDLTAEIAGKNFKSNLGEFCMSAFPVVEKLTTMKEFMVEVFSALVNDAGIKRIIVAADMALCGDDLKKAAAEAGDKDITLLTPEPVPGRGFSQELLGYSLFHALGIRGEELQG